MNMRSGISNVKGTKKVTVTGDSCKWISEV
jgi:hypothetical protein